jgi:hypothetical protein
MKGSFLLILALAGNLPFPRGISAQPPAQTPMRQVKGRSLYSADLPTLQLRFARPYKFAGSQEIILYDRARAEQFCFVDADEQGRIKRMYLAQFEGYLPQVEGAYDYPDTQAVFLAGQRYLVAAGMVPDVPAALAQNPHSDAAQAASYLESRGYRFGEAIAFQRYLRLVDQTRRHEFILLYIEGLGAGAEPDPEKALRGLSERALKGFTVLR